MSQLASRNGIYRHMTIEITIEQGVAALLKADAAEAAVPFAEKDLLRRVLDFANTERPGDLPGARVLTEGGQTFPVITPEQEEAHAELHKDLSAIVTQGNLSAASLKQLLRWARHVTVRTYAMEHGKPVEKHRHFVSDLRPLVADVLLRVLSSPDLRKDVRQCQFPGCARFFLASDLVTNPSAKGRRPYRYCAENHARTPGALRTAKWRRESSKRLAKHK